MYNPKAKHSCSVVGCTDPHVSLHRLPTKEHHQLDSTPPDPPTVTTRAGLAIGRTGQCPRGRCTFLGRSPPPPPSVVGRNGRREEISRTSLRNSLFTAAPPPSTITITPPPPVGGRSCGCQGRIWFPVQPWSQHSPQQSTHT